jgi:hypothetical protein
MVLWIFLGGGVLSANENSIRQKASEAGGLLEDLHIIL